MVSGGAGLPTSVEGNGIYDDVNGNGRADFADVVLYFNQMTWIAGNEPIWRSTTTATVGSTAPTSSGSSTTSEDLTLNPFSRQTRSDHCRNHHPTIRPEISPLFPMEIPSSCRSNSPSRFAGNTI